MKLSLLALAGVVGLSGVHGNQLLKNLIEDSHREWRIRTSGEAKVSTTTGKEVECVDGVAVVDGEGYECSNVDFLSLLSLADLKIAEPVSEGTGSDIWGWLSPSGQEITIMTLDNGSVLVDGTDPINPCILAKLPTTRIQSIWSDVKVYENTMYFIKDLSSRVTDTEEGLRTGVEVWDLLQFDGIDCSADDYEVPVVGPTYVVPRHGRSHNVLVNTETARLYTVGAEFCDGGLVAFDLTNRLEPEFIRCVDGDGYTHDAQCVIYDGPDTHYDKREICFAFNEDTLTIWDVTDLETEEAKLVSITAYDNQAYSHQGWLNREMTKILLDDELDEFCNLTPDIPLCLDVVKGNLTGQLTTSTYIFDVTDLEKPVLESQYIHPDRSIDHNLYVWGAIHEKGWGGNGPRDFFPDPRFAYLNNYMAGLKVLDIRDENSSNWKEVGSFDLTPNSTEIQFLGVWSGYMHPSGAYAMSSFERGLFFVRPNMAFSDEFPPPPDIPFIVVLAIGLGLIALVVLIGLFIYKRQMDQLNAGGAEQDVNDDDVEEDAEVEVEEDKEEVFEKEVNELNAAEAAANDLTGVQDADVEAGAEPESGVQHYDVNPELEVGAGGEQEASI